jgi:hypothetical protein
VIYSFLSLTRGGGERATQCLRTAGMREGSSGVFQTPLRGATVPPASDEKGVYRDLFCLRLRSQPNTHEYEPDDLAQHHDCHAMNVKAKMTYKDEEGNQGS